MVDEEPSQEELTKMRLLTDNKKLIIVRNKIDKTENRPFTLVKIPLIEISAKFGDHFPDLEQAIYEAAEIPTLSSADVIVTNARHYDALTRAHDHLQRVLNGLGAANSQVSVLSSQLPPDLVAEDLRLTLDTLAEITGGQITPNEVLGNIFKNFCVGK
jgi:tRNA modification GTPase